MMINRNKRLQYLERLMDAPMSTQPHWRAINLMCGGNLVSAVSDRDVTLQMLADTGAFKGLKIADVKGMGIDLARLPARDNGTGVGEADSVRG